MTMLDPVTQRYAEALFRLARSQSVPAGTLDAVQSDVQRLATEFAQEGVGSFFVDARIPLEDRRSRIQGLIRDMNPITQNFVNLLFDKHREAVLLGIGEAFHQRTLDERGAAEGVVESARPLGSGELAELEVALGKRLGKQVTLEQQLKPELLGGVRLLVGSKMIDHSLQGRLTGLKRRLLDAALPAPSEA